MINFNEIISDAFLGAFKTIVKTIANGDRKIKRLLVIDLVLIFVVLTIAILIGTKIISQSPWNAVAGILGVLTALLFILIAAYASVLEKQSLQTEINEIETRARENPNETQAAWELARIKLESYLSRNLVQIKWIFVWTIIIMLIGFGLITWGIIKVYQSENNLNASIISTVSGILIEIIGATFLFVYKSTMQQAKEFVSVLERINAVGMSLQIIDSIDSQNQVAKDTAKIELSKQILSLYSFQQATNGM